jgi:hypothetical protein
VAFSYRFNETGENAKAVQEVTDFFDSLDKSLQNAPHFAVFSGCCSETSGFEQL